MEAVSEFHAKAPQATVSEGLSKRSYVAAMPVSGLKVFVIPSLHSEYSGGPISLSKTMHYLW